MKPARMKLIAMAITPAFWEKLKQFTGVATKLQFI